MSHFAKVNSRDDLPRLIAQMQQAGAPQYPLIQALYAGRLAYLPLFRTTSSTTVKRWIGMVSRPGIVTIGDDDHAAADGPKTWPVAPRLLKWANLVIVHGATGHAAHYMAAAMVTEMYRRVVLIECSSANIEPWKRAIDLHHKRGGMVLTPGPGQSHPCPSPQGAHH